MNESTTNDMIATATTTTNSTENHESAAAMNEIFPTTNTLAHAPDDQYQLLSPVSISCTTFHAECMPWNWILNWIMIYTLPCPRSFHLQGEKGES
jgi:hypothetical protein